MYRNLMRRAAVAAGALVLLGCMRVATLRPGAERIRLVNQEPPGCDQLGDVTGKSTAERDPEAALQGARNDLRNRAQAMGATHVVLQNSSSDKVFGVFTPAQETVVSGVALRCAVEGAAGGAQASTQASAPAPAKPQPRCRASELPQWKDARPQDKKKLLDYCSAPAGSPDPGMPKLDD